MSKIKFGRTANTGSTVFLTGSTGFLGTQILRYTLTKRAFDKVVLLVYDLDERKGLDRVRKTAKIAGWWRESFASAIEVWNGALSAERLGLNDSQWSALCGRPSAHNTIDAAIHNGAVVHWTTNYDGLKMSTLVLRYSSCRPRWSLLASRAVCTFRAVSSRTAELGPRKKRGWPMDTIKPNTCRRDW